MCYTWIKEKRLWEEFIMSLYENINKRKKAGTSRSKSKSTITKESYANMISGFKEKKKKPTKKA